MLRFYIKIFSTLVLVLLFSCIDNDTELSFGRYKQNIVIEGVITDKPNFSFINVSLSSSNIDSIEFQAVTNASINILENNNKVYPLIHRKNGHYTSDSLIGKINSEYKMQVEYNGLIYEAVSKIQPVGEIDTVIAIKVDDEDDKEKYILRIYAEKAKQNEDSYYRINAIINDSLLNSYRDLLIYSDQFHKNLLGLDLPYTLNLNDTVVIQVLSLSAEVADYYTDINELTYDGINSSLYYPANPRSNISNNALGYFQTSAVVEYKLIVKP